MRDKKKQRHRQKEMQAPCGDPDVGLIPSTLGSRPEPKGDAQLLSHQVPQENILMKMHLVHVLS